VVEMGAVARSMGVASSGRDVELDMLHSEDEYDLPDV
jgi:hypothetical protein